MSHIRTIGYYHAVVITSILVMLVGHHVGCGHAVTRPQDTEVYNALFNTLFPTNGTYERQEIVVRNELITEQELRGGTSIIRSKLFKDMATLKESTYQEWLNKVKYASSLTSMIPCQSPTGYASKSYIDQYLNMAQEGPMIDNVPTGMLAFMKANPSACGYVILSPVAFDEGRSQALVYLECNLPGHSIQGAFYLLELNSKGWQLISTSIAWVT